MVDKSYIIPPVDREVLKKELNDKTFVRRTNKGDNEIYIVNYHNSPNVLREIGRLRELTFSASGGGTGKEIDIDKYDIADNCYEQLIVYSSEDEEIIGGYRFIKGKDAISNNSIDLSTINYFNFSEDFINHYLPYTIELGRSWVQPKFQPMVNPRKGIFALDNIWDGLGAIVVENPEIKYFFGKVTMYSSYNTEARDAILYFMHHFFPDNEGLVKPINKLTYQTDTSKIAKLIVGKTFKEAHKILTQYVRALGEFIPPLINIYMQISPSMKTFGTAVNPDFGGVEETGILVTIADLYQEKTDRHINTYKKKN